MHTHRKRRNEGREWKREGEREGREDEKFLSGSCTVTMSHTIYLSVHFSLLAFVAMRLVWFEVSSFCYTIDTQIPIGYDVVVFVMGSCSLGSECLALSHALGVGVDQLSTGSGPGGLLSWQTCQLSLIDTHRTSSPTLRGIADHCSRHWEARAVLLLSLGPSHPHPLHQGLFYSFDQAR